jgi:hypothetical protein
MKIYVHYDAEEPAHTEVMKFDGDADVTFEVRPLAPPGPNRAYAECAFDRSGGRGRFAVVTQLARLFYVDAYKSKHGVALDPSSLVATNRVCTRASAAARPPCSARKPRVRCGAVTPPSRWCRSCAL